MLISVNSDDQNLVQQRSLASATNIVNVATGRLASGVKINRTADDASGLHITKSMESQISGLKVAQKNIDVTTNFIQVADSALSEMNNITARMRDLLLQAASGYNSEEAKVAVKNELDQLSKQLKMIQEGTTFSDVKVFNHYAPVQGFSKEEFMQNVSTSPIATTYGYSPALASSFTLRAAMFSRTPASSGYVDLAGNTTDSNCIIDGKTYTITNNSGSAKRLSYILYTDGTIL